jgi:two-component system OmpR family sensor kinase
MLPKSIRWKIQAFHGFILVVLVTALIGGFYGYERRARYRELDTQLLELITPLLPKVSPRPGGRFERPAGRRPSGPDEDFGEAPRRREPLAFSDDPAMARFATGKYYFVSWTPEGSIAQQSTNAPAGLVMPSPEELPEERVTIRTRENARELLHATPSGGLVLVGASTAAIQGQLLRLSMGLTFTGVAVVALGLAGGWWLAGRAIRPISAISSAAEAIATGALSQRISVSETESELGRLAGVLNHTFEKLEQSFQQQVRFTADASHELRTPLSVILTQTQLALSRERSPQEYQEVLAICERAAERMRVLVNSLLELARVDSGEFALVREDCDLSRIAREAIDFIQPLAEQKKVKLHSQLETTRSKVDPMKLAQVLINLLTNAIQHNPEATEVSVFLQSNGDRAIFRISDTGKGIPAEAMPHLFERFFRADKARSRNSGNSGLGLAISKAIVEAHGGTLQVASTPGKGAEFVIDLPLGVA